MPSLFETSVDVEKAFYSAFMRCDMTAMAELWAEGEVICVHPGSPVIAGSAAVLRSWEHIFEAASTPDLKVSVVKKTLTDTLAVHVVEEHITAGNDMTVVVIATNVYQKLSMGWLMVAHHGSVSHAHTAKHTVQ